MIEIIAPAIGIIYIMIDIAPLFISLIILLKISISFYKNKPISFFSYVLYIFLGLLAGGMWGGWWDSVVLSPLKFFNPVRVYLSIVAGVVLGLMVKLPKINFVKILFSFMLIIFITSPIIGSFFPTIPSDPLWGKPEEKAKMAEKIAEEKIKINLSRLRLEIAKYYEKKGFYPPNFKHKILTPKVSILYPRIYHLDSNKVLIIRTQPNQKIQPNQITDEGGWIYSPDSGDIRINCSHKDSIGVPYYEW